jgi:uncharacterized protein (DUF305 family)
MEHQSKHSPDQLRASHQERQPSHYVRLALMMVLSFVAMYILMYAMVDRLDNVYNNINQFYMAGLMAAPMLVLEMVLMGGMYQNRRLNAFLVVIGAAAALFFWVMIRQQVAVSDQQFLRSMIPHHGGAILMCKQNRLRDPELQRLCSEIIASQQREIDLMQSKLH